VTPELTDDYDVFTIDSTSSGNVKSTISADPITFVNGNPTYVGIESANMTNILELKQNDNYTGGSEQV